MLAHVAEDHPLHGHRGAEIGGDSVQAPIRRCPLVVPGVEDREDRLAQLLARILGEALAGVLLVEIQEARGERPQR